MEENITIRMAVPGDMRIVVNGNSETYLIERQYLDPNHNEVWQRMFMDNFKERYGENNTTHNQPA